MTNSPNAMPGAFNFHPREPAAPRLSGAKSHIFQPPRTPSASASSSLILTRSTQSVMSISSAGDTGRLKPVARKRTLEDYNGGEREQTPRGGEGYFGWEVEGRGANAVEGDGWMPASPRPFVNTRYALAGGMDTPSLAAAREVELGTESYNDDGYRRSLGEVERPAMTRRGLFGEHEDPSLFPMEQDFGREANGRGRYGDSPRSAAWSKTAISVAGAVVGKVWEFCRNSTAIFSGFHAGGGTGYRLNPEDTARNFEVIEEEKYSYDGREGTPLPGQYPPEELEFIGDYMDNPTPEHTPPRPSKRRQVSYNSNPTPNENELAKNWVVVPPVPVISTPSKSQRSTGVARYSMPTSSSSARRSVVANTSRPASRAAFGTTPRAKSTLTSRVSHAGSPALTITRGASYASPRHSPSTSFSSSRIPVARSGVSPSRSGTGGAVESPAAKEAARWAALKRKEEREQDESLRRLDRQLKDLIREGKEALGTKIEVEIEDEVPRGGVKKWAF
ncbi:hypothetical protein L207DRAFT_149652 [Hyaloscypha variabilis F]|uniref:Uncharacterized protein n=1 Tax=Hyaloscypha variabilis (strain UAMH 11265 / GT02V1 / F) TaxID=1149755 RepID=A0A2J6S859_HYAVF|nr:hypothetical protein L207DRAFT_149652 [Hyaloscypha variabilis F]